MTGVLRLLRRFGFLERRWIPEHELRDAHERTVRGRLRRLVARRH
jgi:hypothetical protein